MAKNIYPNPLSGVNASKYDTDSYARYGTALWGRFTTAAASLATNVNLTWAANVGTDTGSGKFVLLLFFAL